MKMQIILTSFFTFDEKIKTCCSSNFAFSTLKNNELFSVKPLMTVVFNSLFNLNNIYKIRKCNNR